MKNTAFVLTAATAVALITTAAIAQTTAKPEGKRGDRVTMMFDRLDTNRDGAISQAETQAQRTESFARLDGNKDGSVTKAEMQAAREKMKAAADGRGERRDGGMRGFDRADANKDGKVTLAEWNALPNPLFDRADANKDGKVTREEMTSLMGNWGRRGR